MKRQNGAALVVVLSLLVVALMVGLSSMQSSQIDERLAGNYKSSAEAQMRAEEAVSRGYAYLLSEDDSVSSDDFSEQDPLDMDWTDFSSFDPESRCLENVSCFYYYHDDSGSESQYYVVGYGRVISTDGVELAVSEKIFAEVDLNSAGGGGSSPFSDGVIGCEGVTIENGGNVASRVRTLSQDANVSLTGGTYVQGDVISSGGVVTGGSGRVGGDIRANADVTIDASAQYGGSLFSRGNVVLNNTAQFAGGIDADGDITFNNGARFAGDLSSGKDVTLANTGAYVGGDMKVAGNIVNNFESWKSTESFVGGGVSNQPHSPVSAVSVESCDFLSLPEVFDGFSMSSNGPVTVGDWPRVNATVTPDRITSFDQTWNVQEDVVLAEAVNDSVIGFDEEVPVIRTGDLSLTNGEMRITGGDVIIYVDGDLALGSGGGNGLTIDPGSTLTIFVSGSTHVMSSTQMSSLPIITRDRPTFSLYSNSVDSTANQSSVRIDGSAKAMANVYAPFSNVIVGAGGGLNGSVRAKTVEVSGGGGITYDQELRDWLVEDGGSGESGGSTATPSILSWR